MKTNFKKLAAILLCVCIMLSVGIVLSAQTPAAGEVETDFTKFLPADYVPVVELINGTNSLDSARIGNHYENLRQQKLDAYPMVKDAYGLQRLSNQSYGYVDVKVETASEYFAIGMMVSKTAAATANLALTYYVTDAVDYANAEWKPFDALGYSEPTYSAVGNDDYANIADYCGKVEVVGNLPKGTTYLRVVVYNTPGYWWTPVIDFIDVYDVDVEATGRYDRVLAQDATPTTVIEHYDDADYSAIKIKDSNMQKKNGGVAYRVSSDNNYFAMTDNANGYISFTANSKQVIETVIIFDTNNIGSMSSGFYYATDVSDIGNIVWEPIPNTSIAKKTLGGNNDTGNPIADKTYYCAYAYRFYNLPSDIAAIKLELGSKNWAPTIDYIDIYDVSTGESVDFDNALSKNGYDTLESFTYFDTKGESLDAIFADSTYYNGIEMKERGSSVGGRNNLDGYYGVSVTNISNPYVIIPVDDSNAIETGYVVNTSQISNGTDYAYLTYFTSKDKQSWYEVSQSNISTKTVDKSELSTLGTGYALRKQRVINLPEGTKYIKVCIKTTSWWFNLLDYIDVYGDYDNSFDGYSVELESNYLDNGEAGNLTYSSTDAQITKRGMGGRDGNEWSLSLKNASGISLDGLYAVIPVNDTNFVEVGMIVGVGQASKMSFYTTSDELDAETVTWQKLQKNISTLNITSNSTYVNSASYVYRQHRINGIPEGTKYLKVKVYGNNSWWHTVIDYIDVYSVTKNETPPCTHTGAKEYYNPINNTVEKYCANDGSLYIKGDANESGAVDIRDLVKLCKIAGNPEYADYDIYRAECNTAAGIDASDIVRLRDFVLGNITHAFKD